MSATFPVFLTMLAADLWGGAEFWGAWHSEDERLGVHSPINAFDHFIVQPLDRRIKRSRKREHASPKRDLFIPKELSQRGAVGGDITIRRTANSHRAHGGAPSKKNGGGSSDDGGGGGKGDGELPPPVTLPAEVLRQLAASIGEDLSVVVSQHTVILRPARGERRRYTLGELLASL
ncbi:hypothetical protein [Acidithiobacillus sp.]|uniref:AbrB/MazE/SpoVT family DNA-binding domain-containing protein n=1 Tax=Acidithiobacillus sp. TaxID=1872118 RepID=UPI003563866D